MEDLAREALASGNEEAALAQLAPEAEKAGNARLWQFCGLLQRSLDRHSEAINSFAEASRLDPDDAGIAHGLARVTLEAGLDAVASFERAGRLDPTSGAVLLGLIAAKLAAGRGLEAEAQLDAVLERSPLWIDGHAQLAQLRAMLGKSDQAQSSIERALTAQPNEQGLWAGVLNLALGQEDFAALEAAVARARGAGLPEALISPFEAIAAAELNQADRADRLFETMAPADRDSIAHLACPSPDPDRPGPTGDRPHRRRA